MGRRKDKREKRDKKRAKLVQLEIQGESNKRAKKPTKADLADRHALYERAVQVPEADVEFFEKVYRGNFKRAPLIMREDFCGTFTLSCEWLRAEKGKRKRRKAIGVDLDEPTLDWGREHNLTKLPEEARERITLIRDDVRVVQGEKADIVAAQNFSYFIFKTRDELRGYLRAAYENLADEGVMILDIFGGHLVLKWDHGPEERKLKGFTYLWDQRRFNPITNEVLYHIHFQFKDGSELRKAFTYDWRLWSIAELRELLAEVGFARSDVYWEGTDEEAGEGNGIYKRTKDPDNDPAWVAYVAAIKK